MTIGCHPLIKETRFKAFHRWFSARAQNPVFRWTPWYSSTHGSEDVAAARLWMGCQFIHRVFQGAPLCCLCLVSELLYLNIVTDNLFAAGDWPRFAYSKIEASSWKLQPSGIHLDLCFSFLPGFLWDPSACNPSHHLFPRLSLQISWRPERGELSWWLSQTKKSLSCQMLKFRLGKKSRKESLLSWAEGTNYSKRLRIDLGLLMLLLFTYVYDDSYSAQITMTQDL